MECLMLLEVPLKVLEGSLPKFSIYSWSIKNSVLNLV